MIFILFVCLALGCKSGQSEAFQLFYQNFQEKIEAEPLLRAFLEEQLFFDSLQVIPHQSEVHRILTFSKTQLEELHHFKLERIDEHLHEHHNNLHSFLDIIIQNIEVKKIHKTNPELYSVLPFLKSLIQSEDIEVLRKGLNQTTSHFIVAIENLKQADPMKLDAAVSESIGVFEFLSNEIKDHILSLKPEKEIEQDIFTRLSQTKLEVKNFIGFCNSGLFENGQRE